MSIELKRMTPSRAAYFMERFKREEKLLGPNEQAALTYVIDMLEKATAIQQAEAQQPAVGERLMGQVSLPDGSAFAIASFPLPKDHWLYAPREYATGAGEPLELPAPILTHSQREAVVAAIRYAVRGATMCGREQDFDPDAMVQNAVYALCGPYARVSAENTQTSVNLALFRQPATLAPVAWNSIQIASWIGSQLMHQPSMFERSAVCKFVRSLGRHPTLLKHSPSTHSPAALSEPATGEPVYQIRKAFTQDAEWAWRDATEALFHMHPKEHRRILYTRPEPSVPDAVALDRYDAGILNDFGGGNVEWWQDYIRAELGHAHDFYQSQIDAAKEGGAT